MQALSKAEMIESFTALAGLGQDRVQCDERGLFYSHPEANCFGLEYPPKLERLPFFARMLATIGYDIAHFGGALLWFTTWGVWNSRDEAAGYRIVEAMNRAAGQLQSFEIAPGHIFRQDELTDAIGMLMQPMVFGWDAYYLPLWSFGYEEFFLHVSHGSFVTVVTRTTTFHEEVVRVLKELELEPLELQKKAFCRA